MCAAIPGAIKPPAGESPARAKRSLRSVSAARLCASASDGHDQAMRWAVSPIAIPRRLGHIHGRWLLATEINAARHDGDTSGTPCQSAGDRWAAARHAEADRPGTASAAGGKSRQAICVFPCRADRTSEIGRGVFDTLGVKADYPATFDIPTAFLTKSARPQGSCSCRC
jgi:hypothetical protein